VRFLWSTASFHVRWKGIGVLRRENSRLPGHFPLYGVGSESMLIIGSVMSCALTVNDARCMAWLVVMIRRRLNYKFWGRDRFRSMLRLWRW
jgi:hypothetical protein